MDLYNLIRGLTRSWRRQKDSLLDHVWSNCDQLTVRTWNEDRGASDHNVVGVELAAKVIQNGGQNSLRRCWKKFEEKDMH